MARKESVWEHRRKIAERAQIRARKLISELQNQGYEVRSTLVDLVNRPLRSRYTEKQLKTYLSLTHASAIKSAAKSASGIAASRRKGIIKVPQLTIQKHMNIKSVPRYQEQIDVRVGREQEDLARAFYKHMKFTMNVHPSQDADLVLWRTFKLLKQIGLASKSTKLRQGELQKYINSISEKDFVRAYVDYAERGAQELSDLSTLRKIFYGMGRSSEQAYESYRQLAFEQAKITFGKNFNLGADDVDKIYNFFSNSKSWNEFKKRLLDSEQEDFGDIVEEIVDAVDEKGLATIDSILSTSTSLDEMLKKIRR